MPNDNAPEVASPSTQSFEVVEPEVSLTGVDTDAVGDATSSKNVRQTVENSTNFDNEQPADVSEAIGSTTVGGVEINGDASRSSTYYGEVVSSTPSIVVVVKQGGKTESFPIGGDTGLQRVESPESVHTNEQASHEDSTESSASISTSEQNVREFSSTTDSSENFEPSERESWPDLGGPLPISDASNGESSTATSNDVSTTLGDRSESSSEMSSVASVLRTDEASTVPSSSEKPTESGSTVDPIDMSSTTIESALLGSSIDDILTSSTTPPSQESTPQTRGSSAEPCAESSSRSTFEDDETTNAENPEYPYIPDDLSIHCKQSEDDDDYGKHRHHGHAPQEMRPSSTESIERASSETPAEVSSESILEVSPESPVEATPESLVEASPESPVEALSEPLLSSAAADKQSTTPGPLGEEKDSHEMDLIQARAPGEPHLIPEWERPTTAKPLFDDNTAIEPASTTNGPHISIESPNKLTANNETGTRQPDTVNTSSEEINGNKEPTTERSTTRGYTDDTESDDLLKSSTEIVSDTIMFEQSSPKDDAEAIKLTEGYDSGSLKRSFQFIPDVLGEYWRVYSELDKKELSS